MSFEEYLTQQKLAESTIKKHLKNLDVLGTKESQKKFIDAIEPNTLAVQLSLAGTASKFLQYRNSPNDELVAYIKSINEQIKVESEKRQKLMSEDTTLPTMKQLKDRMNELYDNADYKGFCIMYLMITYQVRNMDMIATSVYKKKDTNTTDNFFVVGRSQVTWIRNKYKTAFKYGTKINIIKNKKFIHAINIHAVSGLELLSPTDNIDRVIKKISGGITESTITKIVLRDNNTINGLKKVSTNRGTDINTLINSYNIT